MNMKKCTTCLKEKPYSEFHKDKTNSDGYRYHCKSCRKTDHAENKEVLSERSRLWREKTGWKDSRKWGDVGERKLKWAREHRGLYNAHNAKRRARQLKATPRWADEEKIKSFYHKAKEEELRTGDKMHVDHIVPLQGRFVCGLHCEDNLQILSQEENCSKHNRFNVDDT